MRRRGGFSFGTAMRLLAPYSPRLAYNFIDPANSLFQGNTLMPVTSATNPVGLVIDQTQGGLGNLGAELVTNGGFDSDTDWTKGTGWTISGGVASRPNIGSGTSLMQAVALTANSLYLLTYTLTQTSGNFNTAFQGGSSVFGPNRTTGGTYTEVLRAVSGSNTLAFQAGSTFAGTIDNVSLRLIPGNHATASSDAKRPLFARYPATGRRNLLISTEDFSNAAWAKVRLGVVGEVCTVNSTNASGSVLIQTSLTLGVSYTCSVDMKYNNSRWCAIRIGTDRAWFDIQNGVVGTKQGAGSVSSITDIGNGYYRCRFSHIPTTLTTFYIYPATDGDNTDAGTLNQQTNVARVH